MRSFSPVLRVNFLGIDVMSKFMYPTPVGIANYNDNKTDFKSFLICIEGNRRFPNKNFGKDNYLSDR